MKTGDIEFDNVISLGEIKLKTNSGDIELNRCDASALNIETSSGDVEGTLLTSKIFYATSSSGDISVPISENGGICNIKTKRGDIEFTIIN